MSEAATETVVATTTPAAPEAPPPEAKTEAKPAGKDGKEPAKEAPKAPPSAKDWSAVTIAEKRLRAQGERIKAEQAKLEADRAAIAAERQQASAGMDALKKAYNDGDYSKLEAEFPELYKRLTQAKLKAGKPAPKVEAPVTKESILAEIKAEQKAEAEKAQQAQQAQYRIDLENTLVTTVRAAAAKFPQLAIEIEESPDLIRDWLHGMDAKTILNKDGKPFSSMEEAAAEMESRFQARLDRRQKALAGQPAPKTATDSPRDQDGQQSGSGGPTTLSSRLSQESALPPSSSGSTTGQSGDGSPTTSLRLRQEQERRDLERAIAEFSARK